MTRTAWVTSAIAFAVVTRVLASPLIDLDHLRDASYPGDSRLLIWTLAWDAHALLTATPFHNANMFFPETQALKWAEHHIGIGVFALPIYAISRNAILTYWLTWLVAFPLNALAMQAFAFRVTRDHVAAFGAGLVYAFCFFRMHHAHGHLQMLWTWALPLAPLALERWMEKPTVARAGLVTALVLVQALSSWYLAAAVALLMVVTAPILAARRRLALRHLLTGAPAVIFGVLILWWLARPYLGLPRVAVSEVAANSADIASYLVPPENTWSGQWIAANTSLQPRWIWGEQTLYVGAVTLVLAAIGLWAWRRRPDRLTAAIVVTGLVALLLSFGPGGGLTPFDFLARVPALALLRAPGRLALLVMLALALVVAHGVVAVRARIPRWSLGALAAMAVLGLSESYVVNFPGGKPQKMPVPEVYQRLATLPLGAVVSLPTYRFAPDGFREADYLLFSTAHWRPIVNGFGRHEPPQHKERMQAIAEFPAASAVSRLQELGVRYVILHTARASELRQAASEAERHPAITSLGTFGDDFLYAVATRK